MEANLEQEANNGGNVNDDVEVAQQQIDSEQEDEEEDDDDEEEEEDEDDAAQAGVDLQVEDPTMILTRQEIGRALQIKEAAQNHGATLQELTDFEYVQYALCCAEEDNMDKILNRMEMMQAFKEEYKIMDTPEDGLEIISQLLQEQPGFFLSVAYLESSKNYLSVIDWAQLYPANIKTWRHYRMYLGYLYYSLHCKLCQFQAIREGSSLLVECEGVTLENYDHDFFSRMQHELMRWYPTNQRETFLLNSPGIANIAFALWRKFMSKDQLQAIHLGHQIDGLDSGQRIDVLYKMPTPEIATQNLLLSVQMLLEHRYQNEQQFRLDLPGITADDIIH